jgi:hypothetical protein
MVLSLSPSLFVVRISSLRRGCRRSCWPLSRPSFRYSESWIGLSRPISVVRYSYFAAPRRDTTDTRIARRLEPSRLTREDAVHL